MREDVRVGPCLIRPRLNTITNGDHEHRLEPKAMAVLALLMARPGDVVSREEIFSRVWQGRLVSDEVLTNVVSQIRRALGDDPKSPQFIQTIAKNGYRLIAPVASPRASNSRIGWVASLAVLGAVAAFSGLRGESPSGEVPRLSNGLVLVHPFESLSDDRDLDWLRPGIAELMVTGLSQMPRLRVFGPSQNAARGVSETDASFIIEGSFARFGERLRIDARAKDPHTGELVAAESVEGESTSELFELVDELAVRLALRLELVQADEPHLNRALRDVATGSIDAYRHYVEGMRRYYYNLDHNDALESYRNAIAIDPSFGMAHAKMAIVYMNVGDYASADASARKAVDHADRLPELERHYVTGNFYVTHEETYAAALESYRKALQLDDAHLAARHNIAFIYFRLERYREAIHELEELVRTGVRFPGSYRLLMMSYAALGEFEEGQRIADAYLARHPDKWIGYRNLGQHLMRWGRLSEADEALYRAEALRPGTPEPNDWWQLKLLQEESAHFGSVSPSRDRPSAAPRLGLVMERLYTGRARDALRLIDDGLRASDAGSDWAPVLLNLSASIHLQMGEHEASLRAARRAAELGRGNAFEWHATSLAARAHAQLGSWSEADRLTLELEEKTAEIPTHKERRRLHHLRGELALLRGRPEDAIAALEKAEKLLAPRGFPVTMQVPQHVPIRFALAEAYRVAEQPREAARWHRSVTESTTERLVWPVLFVRSFYQLGVLHDAAGKPRRAVANYRRFLSFWEHGGLDRAEVSLARSRIGSYEALTPRRSTTSVPTGVGSEEHQ